MPLAQWKADPFVLINPWNEFSGSLSTCSVNALIVCERPSEEKNAKRWKVRRAIFNRRSLPLIALASGERKIKHSLSRRVLTQKWGFSLTDWRQQVAVEYHRLPLQHPDVTKHSNFRGFSMNSVVWPLLTVSPCSGGWSWGTSSAFSFVHTAFTSLLFWLPLIFSFWPY